MSTPALDTLLSALDLLTEPAAVKAADELRKLATDSDSPWQSLALELSAQVVAEQGADGLRLLTRQLTDVMRGKADSIDVTDARVSHLLLAELEKSEIKDRRAAKRFMSQVGNVMGQLGAALVAGVVSGSIKVVV